MREQASMPWAYFLRPHTFLPRRAHRLRPTISNAQASRASHKVRDSSYILSVFLHVLCSTDHGIRGACVYTSGSTSSSGEELCALQLENHI